MDFFPMFARIADQPCLVVGGGEVAHRKVNDLLSAGARVTVNAPEVCAGLQALVAAGRVTLQRGMFEPSLVPKHLLVVAATADRGVNATVAALAHREHRFCNVVDDGESSSFIVPAVIDRAPIVLAISSGGRAPLLARLLRQRLERWLPRGLGELAAWIGGWRERARQALPDSLARRHFWERLLTGPAAQHALAGNAPLADAAAARALRSVQGGCRAGIAWLVGAGPGDPGLITLRGLEALQTADVVLHDRLVGVELLGFARREAELINVGKIPGGGGTGQEAINELLVSRVRAGQRVCRLKGGDPLVFGRGGEEALALASAGLPFEIIPGVTAAAGCAASAGVPLTHRELASGVTLVTASGASSSPAPDWATLARLDHTLVVYMGAARIAEVCDELQRAGRAADTPAVVVSEGTTPRQRQVAGTLAEIAGRSVAAGIGAPALLFVGRTAALAVRLNGQHEAIEAHQPPGVISVASAVDTGYRPRAAGST